MLDAISPIDEEILLLAELRKRRAARSSLAAYATSIEIPNVPAQADDDEDPEGEDTTLPLIRHKTLAPHHKLICDGIQATVSGTQRVDGQPVNLMLLLPPGSAKSTYADVVGVPWFMATRPPGRGGVILASHSGEIAKRQGRRARQVIRSAGHRAIFPGAVLQNDHGAADSWALSNGAEYIAAGLLSGITGNRASLGILDDPMRGREAAESQTIRDKTWEAYTDDFCSRLLPGAPQIMILTRWHQDDPAGRILPEAWDGQSGLMRGRDGRAWNVICLPAVADRADDPLGRKIGETLWPEWFSPAHWEPFKLNARTWSSLYQQKPSPAEGTYFQRAWFDKARYDSLPADLHVYLTSDHARSEDSGDFTVLRIWGIDTRGDLYWLDGWRGQAKTDVWAAEAISLLRRYRPLCWFPENDATWGAVEPFMRRMMREANVACRIEALPTKGDKVAKAQSFQGMAAQFRVHLPRTPEADAAIDEYIRFPTGKNDDEVDAGSHMGRALMDSHPAIVQTKSAPQSLDPWGRPRADETRDWRVA